MEVYHKTIFFASSGAIRTVMSLDYETVPLFKFGVRVTDLGRPRLSSDTTARVQISILDINDCPPVFTHAEYNASVLLPTYKNVAIAQVTIDCQMTHFNILHYN